MGDPRLAWLRRAAVTLATTNMTAKTRIDDHNRVMAVADVTELAGIAERFATALDCVDTGFIGDGILDQLPTLRDQVIAPILAAVRSPRMGRKPAHWTRVDRDYERLHIDMQTLLNDLAIETPLAA